MKFGLNIQFTYSNKIAQSHHKAMLMDGIDPQVNKGRFRFKPISAFVYIFTLHQSERFKFENINKRSEKILSHSKASVSYNIYFFCLKPKGYIKTGIYLKFCRGTFCNSIQNAKYRCFNLCHDRALLR